MIIPLKPGASSIDFTWASPMFASRISGYDYLLPSHHYSPAVHISDLPPVVLHACLDLFGVHDHPPELVGVQRGILGQINEGLGDHALFGVEWGWCGMGGRV